MATAEDDLQQFNQFVRQRLSSTDRADVSLGELMEEWQLQHPTDEQHAENVAAVKAAIEDFKNGWNDVRDMMKLAPNAPFIYDPVRPVDNQWVANAAPVSVLLVPFER